MITLAVVLIVFFNVFRYAELKELTHIYSIKQYFKYNNHSTIGLNFVAFLAVIVVYLFNNTNFSW